ncbi:hypothetical protein DT73_12830 [Mangrovibacter sp. MFB070]|uniref:hypothetical protein n=1 Tax=Mangrovibacter sp. MFB070 TaxID=1224318 RepID=UPI0004D82DAF|nr:hypothetical protein [Mangrovibacter sp. MFB070]KEA51813.1 hypothetical protein DT73_12830 [Mangrovibacter sp. MFB070]
MAKVIFEFKSDFAKRVQNGVMEGISVNVQVDFQGDQHNPTGALAMVMAANQKEIAGLVMGKLVEEMRSMGDHAEGSVCERSVQKH